MIIINRKRLLLSLGVVTLSLFTFVIQSANSKILNESKETVALPVSNKVIVIDARPWRAR